MEDDCVVKEDLLEKIDKTFITRNKILYIATDHSLIKSKINEEIYQTYFHLSLAAYIINKETAYNLYNYFLKKGISYHIDFELNFIPWLKHYQYINNIYQKTDSLSSMKITRNKIIKNYSINIPLFRINNYEFSGYTLVLLFIFILLFILIYYNIKIPYFLFFILGVFIWDSI